MSTKERIVFVDRPAFSPDDVPIPAFDHNWSEYPFTDAADLVPRLFWATTVITHATPVDAAAIAQLHKLKRIVVTGPAVVDTAACAQQGVCVEPLPEGAEGVVALVKWLECCVEKSTQGQ